MPAPLAQVHVSNPDLSQEPVALVALPQLQLSGCSWAPPCWQEMGRYPLPHTPPLSSTTSHRVSHGTGRGWTLGTWGRDFCILHGLTVSKPLHAMVCQAHPMSWSSLVPHTLAGYVRVKCNLMIRNWEKNNYFVHKRASAFLKKGKKK